MRLIGLLGTPLLALMVSPVLADECLQMVDKNDLQARIIDGVEVYVVKRDAVHQPCNLYPKAREAAVKAQAKNQELLGMLEEMNNKYKELYKAKESYYDLVIKYEKALNKSSALVGDFEAQSDRWANLYRDYKTLANDYDELSDTYRKIAQNFHSPISFEIGGGVTEDHNFAGVIGVGVQRFKVWGFIQSENNGILATYNIPWSSF